MGRLHVSKWLYLVGALFLSGCYSYVPAEVAELPVGRPVRVQLSRQAFADLPQISERQGRTLEGTVVRRTDADLTVHVPISMGSEFGQDLTLPANGILQSDVKVLSKAKSAFTALGVLALLGSVAFSTRSNKPIIMSNPGDPNPGEDGFSPFARVLSLSIPIR